MQTLKKFVSSVPFLWKSTKNEEAMEPRKPESNTRQLGEDLAGKCHKVYLKALLVALLS